MTAPAIGSAQRHAEAEPVHAPAQEHDHQHHRGGQHPALAHCHNVPPVVPGGVGQDLHLRSDPFHPWGADEDGVDRRGAEDGHREVRLERVELAAEGVSPHGCVQEPEALH